MATGGCKNIAKVWEYDELSERLKEEMKWNYSAAVRDITFAGSSGLPYNLVATCTDNCEVHIYKHTEGKWTQSTRIKSKLPVWKASWSLLGNLLAVSAANNVVNVYEEKEIDNWELVVDTSND